LLICQRADRFNKIDKPKSESSERTVPLPPMVVNTLREWKLGCPKDDHGRLKFVFPTGTGEIEYHSNILQRGLEPAQIAAGIVDDKGKPKYALANILAAAVFLLLAVDIRNAWDLMLAFARQIASKSSDT
jgi:hypothetical protein